MLPARKVSRDPQGHFPTFCVTALIVHSERKKLH